MKDIKSYKIFSGEFRSIYLMPDNISWGTLDVDELVDQGDYKKIPFAALNDL